MESLKTVRLTVVTYKNAVFEDSSYNYEDAALEDSAYNYDKYTKT